MKRTTAIFLMILLILASVPSFTVFASAVSVTVVADEGWGNATYDSATQILQNVDGGYAFKAILTSSDASATLTLSSLGTATKIVIPYQITFSGTTYTVKAHSTVPAIGYYLLGNGNTTVTSVIVSEGITAVEPGVFRADKGLKDIKFPSTLQTIGTNAFLDDYALLNVEIPAGVTSIASQAFKNCRALAKVTFKGNITTIASGAFQICPLLANVVFEGVTAPTIADTYSFAGAKSGLVVNYPANSVGYDQAAFTSMFPAGTIFTPVSAAETLSYSRGVNIAGAAFGSGSYWNNEATYQYFVSTKGLDAIRLSISWERIQPTLNGALATTYLTNLKTAIGWAKKYNAKVILDLHNYGRYNGEVIDVGTPTTANLVDVWQKLSNEFKNEPTVYAYDIMNEPHDMGTASWKNISQAVVSGIRTNGDNKLLMIEGDGYSTAKGWTRYGLTSWITDPANNFMYQAHLYFDSNCSGTYMKTYDEELALNPTLPWVGQYNAMEFIQWCLNNNVKGFFGEFGVPGNDARWNTVLDNFYKQLDTYKFGATCWAGGAWPTSYPLSLQPTNNFTTDTAQMPTILAHKSATVNEPSDTTIYEAENGTLNGCSIYTDAGASGGNAVGGTTGSGSYCQVSVDGGAGGKAKLVIRYATSGVKKPDLYVNGTLIETLRLVSSNGWNTYWNYYTYVDLNPGTNTIKLQRGSGGSYNLDSFTVSTQ